MSDEPLQEGRDFYWEGSLIVFTAAYHLRRGICCGSRCRNCPFGYVNVPPRDGEMRRAKEP